MQAQRDVLSLIVQLLNFQRSLLLKRRSRCGRTRTSWILRNLYHHAYAQMDSIVSQVSANWSAASRPHQQQQRSCPGQSLQMSMDCCGFGIAAHGAFGSGSSARLCLCLRPFSQSGSALAALIFCPALAALAPPNHCLGTQPTPVRCAMTSSQQPYEVRPRKDHRGVELISDALPFGRLWSVSQTQSARQSTTHSFSAGRIAR